MLPFIRSWPMSTLSILIFALALTRLFSKDKLNRLRLVAALNLLSALISRLYSFSSMPVWAL